MPVQAAPLGGATAPADEKSFADRTYAKVFWRLVPFLMLCYVVAYLDRVNVGFAKLQMSQELKFSETVYGLGAGIFFLGYFLFEVPSNVILHRVGARVWIARIMITWGVISGAFLFVNSEWSFYGMRFLLGLAEAGFYPGVILYTTSWFPAHRRAKVIAVWMPTIVKASGVQGNFNIGLISAIPFLCAAIVMVLLGLSADRMRERRWHLIIPALLGAVGFVVSANAGSTTIAVAALSVAAAGVLTCSPLFWSLPTAFLSGVADDAQRAAWLARLGTVSEGAGYVAGVEAALDGLGRHIAALVDCDRLLALAR